MSEYDMNDNNIIINNNPTMKILLLGSGGREHALAWKITQSEKCDRLFIAPHVVIDHIDIYCHSVGNA